MKKFIKTQKNEQKFGQKFQKMIQFWIHSLKFSTEKVELTITTEKSLEKELKIEEMS